MVKTYVEIKVVDFIFATNLQNIAIFFDWRGSVIQINFGDRNNRLYGIFLTQERVELVAATILCGFILLSFFFAALKAVSFAPQLQKFPIVINYR